MKDPAKAKPEEGYYRIPRPGLLWNGTDDGELLPADGGKKHPTRGHTARQDQEVSEVGTRQPVLPNLIAAGERSDD